MPRTLYGIRNCDTMKRAQAWLSARGLDYRFHDYKVEGIEAARLRQWCAAVGWEALLNTRGTTWRKLTPAQRSPMDEERAIALMSAQPSLIRRPVLEYVGGLLVGFSPGNYADSL